TWSTGKSPLKSVSATRRRRSFQMPRTTIGTGALLIIMGVIAYIATAFASWTALIPAILGMIMIICGLVAIGRPKIGLVLALVVAFMGILGTALNVMQLGELIAGNAERPAALLTRELTFLFLIIYDIIGVRVLITVRGRASMDATDD